MGITTAGFYRTIVFSYFYTVLHVHVYLYTKMGDSIKEVYCNVAVKLSVNIAVHALIESFFIYDIEVTFFLNFTTV